MDEVHYLISDASKKVDVEAHVLRYWEDELGLEIPRNEMGHRYYTDLHIRLFKQVKNLKEKASVQGAFLRSSSTSYGIFKLPRPLPISSRGLFLP